MEDIAYSQIGLKSSAPHECLETAIFLRSHSYSRSVRKIASLA